MSEPYLAELKLVSFNFAPKGWAQCNGAILSIQQNTALFSLLGTTYGGNGQQTFALPNLQGRAPLHVGSGFIQGQGGGEYNHTLTIAELPAHPHFVMGQNSQANTNASNNLLANTTGVTLAVYASPANLTSLNPNSVGHTGGNQPHQNQSPYLVMTWIIALQGIFPSRN
ncbi:MAG TPA: tail fiber protein [Bryobacteraceae bacterium]|jgi:microcystin-dependent protein